jgi:23S rRNA (cytidine2498-2'-O)-methyltransferase
LGEIQRADHSAKLIEWLAPGIGRVETGIDWSSFSSALRNRLTVFCRHINPAQVLVQFDKTDADLDRLVEASKRLLPHLDIGQTFSVQTRIVVEGERAYKNFDVNQRISAEMVTAGAILDVQNPQQVVSVVCASDRGYLGLSLAQENISDWAGGVRRFKREREQVSRAEFKLLEALDLFWITLPNDGLVLDLGAAPGGWTRIMREQGLPVVAVDPADLHPSIEHDAGVEHVRQTAQVYLPGCRRQFDVILNDMRMDARDSARLMVLAADCMKSDGFGLMTLKLPESGTLQALGGALKILRQGYVVVAARQLFHNRSEVTALLRKEER